MIRDTLSLEGAAILADRIRTYWAKRNVKIDVEIQPISVLMADFHKERLFVIRSNAPIFIRSARA